MNSNAKSFLSKLKDINDSNTVDVKLLSSGKTATFKLASVSQQKELIRTAFDGVDGVITRSNAINKLVEDNLVGEAEILIVDKPAILVALRKASIGSDIKVEDKVYSLDNIPTIKKSEVKLTDTIEHDGITVELKVPNLTVDTEINKKLATEFGKLQEIEEKIKQSIDIVVSYESAKYIDSISVEDEKIVFEDLSVFERNEIVNNLPLSIGNKIVDFIGEVKAVADKALTVDKEVVIEIDASFLSAD